MRAAVTVAAFLAVATSLVFVALAVAAFLRFTSFDRRWSFLARRPARRPPGASSTGDPARARF